MKNRFRLGKDVKWKERRRFLSASAGIATTTLLGCGGSGEAATVSVAEPPPDLGSVSPVPPVKGIRWSALSLSAHSMGQHAYSATVLPTRGQIPAGFRILSRDDASIDSSILSTWDDGSIALAIVSGTVVIGPTLSTTLQLDVTDTQPAAQRSSLSPNNIVKLVRSLEVHFDTGTSRVESLLEPERIWWSNSQLICARYRGNSLEGGTLQVVFDVHAYANGTALVEVVVENSGIHVLAPELPRSARYKSAQLVVNGEVAGAVVMSSGSAEGVHSPFRAWYASHRIGSALAVRATQDHLDLQKHPLFFKPIRAATFNMGEYANDRYTPWTTGRQRGVNMGATGDSPSIGYITQWDSRFIQSGDHRAALATEASALACLSFNINYRDISTGRVPDFASIGARDHQTANKYWPSFRNVEEKVSWEVAHHPAAGLVAFVVRPSPVFIEIAQKICVWNGTWSGFGNDTPWSAGLHGRFYQQRGKAWCLRSQLHAAFITPADDVWRAPTVEAIGKNVQHLARWMSDPKQKLNVIWDNMPGYDLFDVDGWPGFQHHLWQQHYMVPVLHAGAGARLLRGAAQQLFESLADWLATQAVRWVNEQADGAWRYTNYHCTIGTDPKTIASLDNWGDMVRWARGDRPASVSGAWMDPQNANTSFAASASRAQAQAGAYWEDIFWSALAVAVERQLPGAKAAFTTVNANITTLQNWLAGFGNDPRFGFHPRNL